MRESVFDFFFVGRVWMTVVVLLERSSPCELRRCVCSVVLSKSSCVRRFRHYRASICVCRSVLVLSGVCRGVRSPAAVPRLCVQVHAFEFLCVQVLVTGTVVCAAASGFPSDSLCVQDRGRLVSSGVCRSATWDGRGCGRSGSAG
jgi:hypothetical protein